MCAWRHLRHHFQDTSIFKPGLIGSPLPCSVRVWSRARCRQGSIRMDATEAPSVSWRTPLTRLAIRISSTCKPVSRALSTRPTVAPTARHASKRMPMEVRMLAIHNIRSLLPWTWTMLQSPVTPRRLGRPMYLHRSSATAITLNLAVGHLLSTRQNGFDDGSMKRAW